MNNEQHNIIVEAYERARQIKREAMANGTWSQGLDANKGLYRDLKEETKQRLIKAHK